MHVLEWAAPPVGFALALLINPWLITRWVTASTRDPVIRLLAGGVAAVTGMTVIPLVLTRLLVAITPLSLAAAHALLAAGLALILSIGRKPWAPADRPERRFLFLLAGLALLTLPVTPLAGIDTYKWQDLATAVGMEQRVPWFTQVSSLVGWTPRAYPPAQPLCLATVQMLGGLGVEAGFFVVSLLTGLVGICSAWLLGLRCFGHTRGAFWFALAFITAPVCVRYVHWATGRGLFVSLLPLFLWSLLELPRRRAWSIAGLSGLLLLLSHRTGLFAVPLMVGSRLAGLCLPAHVPRAVRLWLLVPVLAAACSLAPHMVAPGALGYGVGFVWRALTRFGWMVPLAVSALVFRAHPLAGAAAFVPAGLLSFPLAFASDMYGALMAVPFVALAATSGFLGLAERWPGETRRLERSVWVLCMAGALLVVAQRSVNATPFAVRRAAMALERIDPQGPYRVVAPGRARGQIQAYVSGCPRFAPPTAAASVPASEPAVSGTRPTFTGSADARLIALIRWMRSRMTVGDPDMQWYGLNPRLYYVTLEGRGERPPDAERIGAGRGFEIYKPRGQTDPDGTPTGKAVSP